MIRRRVAEAVQSRRAFPLKHSRPSSNRTFGPLRKPNSSCSNLPRYGFPCCVRILLINNATLLTQDPDPFPYLIPPLGRSYLDVWAEEAGEAPSPSKSSLSEGETGGAPALGPLSERVLALLIREGLVTATTPGDAMLGDSPEDEPTVQPTAAKAAQAFAHPDQLESRIRRELVYVGLLDDFDDPATVSSSAYATATAAARAKSPSASSSLSSASASASASTLAGSSAANGASSSSASNSTAQAESDEICMQMRVLQGLLRQQIVLNNARKARLYGRVRAQLAFQEYESVMNELNQQIEAGYLKRQVYIKR